MMSGERSQQRLEDVEGAGERGGRRIEGSGPRGLDQSGVRGGRVQMERVSSRAMWEGAR